MTELKIIKRYQNRKLYDTGESTYVTLNELALMLKAGNDLRVIDNKTKNDITATTLTQLLHERERNAKVQPSVELLREIICNGHTSFSGYIEEKLATELTAFDKTQTIQPTLNH